MMQRIIACTVALALVSSLCVLSAEFGAGVSSSIVDGPLVRAEGLLASDVLAHSGDFASDLVDQRGFVSGFNLGYITPWNNHGYDVAKKFALKFTHISPVWYQIRLARVSIPAVKAGAAPRSKITVEVAGAQDADTTWVREVQQAGSDHTSKTRVAVVPRFLVEVAGDADEVASIYTALAQKETLQRGVVRKILAELKRIGADGLVLEMSEAWAAVTIGPGKDPKDRNKLNVFLMRLGEALHHPQAPLDPLDEPEDPALDQSINPAAPKQLIVVVRPMRERSADFQNFDFKQVERFVDGFSLMTYDHPSPLASGGPLAPLDWVRQSVLELVGGPESLKDSRRMRKVLMGVPFYGYRYSTEGGPEAPATAAPTAVLGTQFIEELKAAEEGKAVEVAWNAEWAEHSFSVAADHSTKGVAERIFFPTPAFIQKRLELAAELGVGLSVWELGQGLDCFYDLL